MDHFRFLCSALLLAGSLGAAELWRNDFPADGKLLDAANLPPELRVAVGKTLRTESGDGKTVLRTDMSNVIATCGDDRWRDYEVTLRCERLWPNDLALIGRVAPGQYHRHWFLRVVDKPKKELQLGRAVVNQNEILATAPWPEGFDGKNCTLTLRFEGNKVSGSVNGKPLVAAEDDGSFPGGRVGISGVYYTNVRLLDLKVDDLKGAAQPGVVQPLFDWDGVTGSPAAEVLKPVAAEQPLWSSGKIQFEPENVIATREANVLLTLAEPSANAGRIELEAEALWPNDFMLVARQAPDSSYSFWFLAVKYKTRQLELGRMLNGKARIAATVPWPTGADGKNWRLALEFSGGKVAAFADQEKVAETDDDGQFGDGRAGLRGSYYTKLRLKRLRILPVVLPSGSVPTAVAPAPPAPKTDWNLDRAERRINGSREKVSLNNLWNFVPADSTQKSPVEWGFFSVPGHWRGGNISNQVRNASGKPVSRWQGRELSEYPVGWYRRTFAVPEAWRGQTIELYFENLKGVPTLSLNGREFARSPLADNSWRVDLSGALAPGENELVLSLDGSGPAGETPRNGIFGNVWLECRPQRNLGEVSVTPSVTEKTLQLHIPANVGTGTIDLEVADRSGGILLKKTFPIRADGDYRVDFFPEKLWSPETPELLTAVFTLRDQDGNMLDRLSRRFGFREFSLGQGDFLLNNQPYTLRFDTAVEGYWSPDWHFNTPFFRNRLSALKSLNLNGVYMAPDAPDELYDLLDEIGVLALVKGVPTPHRMLNDPDNAVWFRNFEAEIRRHVENPARAGHPAVIGYLIDVWYNYHSGVQNPEYVGMTADRKIRPRLAPDGTVRREEFGDPNLSGGPVLRKQTLDRIAGIYRKYAPAGMEFFCGASGHVDKLYSTHLYHTWGAPESEMRAFFERWSLGRELPVFAGETCIAYLGSFYEIDRWHGGGTPYFFENGARRLGRRAYDYTPVWTRRPFHDTGAEGVMSQHTIPNGELPRIAFHADLYNDLLAGSVERLFPAWRAAGFRGFGTFGFGLGDHYALAGYLSNVQRPALPGNLATGGYKPELFDQYNAVTLPVLPFAENVVPHFTVVAPPLRRALADLTFWIGGAPDFYNDDHAFYGGETLRKQLVIHNDSAEAHRLEFTLRLLDAERRTLAEQRRTVELAPRSRHLEPVEFVLPAAAGRMELCLEAVAGELRSGLNLELFPRRRFPALARKLFLFDPEGKCAAFLRAEGIAFETLEQLNSSLAAGSVLIVGRRALTLAPGDFDPDRLARSGVNILVLEQEPAAAPELVKARQREAFIYDRSHPALAGFTDRDFALWRGSAGTAPAYGNSPAGQNWNGFGNRNMVATHVWRRPFTGNGKTLLASGFDLAQSPLLEFDLPAASWIGCQLDLTERLGVDPVGTALFAQLLSYLDHRGSRTGRAAFFGRDIPGRLEIEAENIAVPDAGTLAKFDTLVIAAPDFQQLETHRNALTEFVYWGGRIIYLHAPGTFSPRWLPFALELGEPQKLQQARVTAPGWNRGWDNAELEWLNAYPVPVFANFNRSVDAADPAVIVRRKFGHGEYWFNSVIPELFGNDFPAAKASRLLAALLLQNGVHFRPVDTAYLPPKPIVEFDLTELKWDFRLDPDNQGLARKWHNSYDPANWLNGLIADGLEVRLGVSFEAFLGRNYDGVAWYRINVELPEAIRNQPELYCIVGTIDDFDEIYINGVKIGATGRETPQWWEHERVYPIPAGVLKPGRNLIAVRVTDDKGEGGIVKGPFKLSGARPRVPRTWTPVPGATRDYEYKADLVRMY